MMGKQKAKWATRPEPAAAAGSQAGGGDTLNESLADGRDQTQLSAAARL